MEEPAGAPTSAASAAPSPSPSSSASAVGSCATPALAIEKAEKSESLVALTARKLELMKLLLGVQLHGMYFKNNWAWVGEFQSVTSAQVLEQ